MIVPFFGDQFFWGQVVMSSGALGANGRGDGRLAPKVPFGGCTKGCPALIGLRWEECSGGTCGGQSESADGSVGSASGDSNASMLQSYVGNRSWTF